MSAKPQVDLTQSGLYVQETRLDMLPEDTPEFCIAISRFTRGVASLALSSLIIRFDEDRIVPVDPVEEPAVGTVVSGVPALELHVPDPQAGITLYNYHPQIPDGKVSWNSWWVMHPGAVGVEALFDKFLQEPTEALCRELPVDPGHLKDIVGTVIADREKSGTRRLPIRALLLSQEVQAITNDAVSNVMWKLGLLDGPRPMAAVTLSGDAV